MSFSWQTMSPADHAAFSRMTGANVVRVGAMYWCAVRAFFYRPLLPLEEFSPSQIVAPRSTVFGGVQHAVLPTDESNSYLNRLAFENTGGYSVDVLDKNRRRQVRLASKEFVVRRIDDVDEFKTAAFHPYLSFYQRTRYKVGARRRDPAQFARWADGIFQLPRVLVLGGYRDGALGGISLSFVVGSTLVYATFYCDDRSLDLYLSDFMLHTIRESAAADQGIREVFVGMHKGGGGLDEFYLHRGAKLIRQRAMVHLNPVAQAVLKYCMPKTYSHVLGELPPGQVRPTFS